MDFEADGGRLEQALDLMVSVALGTNAGGQVVLNVDVHPRDAGVAALVISVEDSGRGLSASARARVFDGFDSASAFWATRSGSSGLELPLAQRLAALVGGTLEVESEPGRGTTLRLPLDVPRTWLMSRPVSEDTRELPAGRLLLVDDDGQQRRVHRALAEACGWSVVEARNGNEAIEVLARGLRVDAVLTELHMPVLDGVGLLRVLSERWPDLPCGVLTADARPDARASVDVPAVAAWAVKPVRTEGMARVLTRLREPQDSELASPPSETAPVDKSALHRLQSLDPVEGPILARQLIEAFVAAAPLQLLGLADALGPDGDNDTADEIGASLALSARLIGLPELSHALAALDAERAEGRHGRDALRDVASEVQRARKALADGATEQPPAPMEVAA